MPSRAKAFLQYAIIIFVTIFLIWFSLRGLSVGEGQNKWEYILETWKLADKGWLMVMFIFAMLSHIIRAMRWKMLLQPTGHFIKLSHSFLSLMVGYIVNIVIPRGGEVSRCYNLYKLNKVPVDVSFGTVVVERIVDLICLLLLIILAFALESQKLFAFIETLPLQFSGSSRMNTVTILLIVGIIVLVALFLFLRRNVKIRTKLITIWQGIRSGLLSIFKLENKGLFVFYSVLIWFFYFFMSYSVIKAFPATADLGFSAVISLFGIGSIAMAAPLPGGTGSYHVLVPQGLAFLYTIPLKDATALTFIFHGWQTFIMILAGAISIIITTVLVRRIKSEKSF